MAKSAKVQLKDSELQNIRSFYEQERFQLLSRLQHVDQVISRLSGGSAPIADGHYAASSPEVSRPLATADSQPEPIVAPKRKRGRPRKEEAVEAKVKKAGRPKKRGPKSVWGNFILRRLRQCDRPLSYSELIRDAMVMHNLPASKEKNAKASILNAAFRLRTHLGKVDSVGMPSKKERFLVLTSWLQSEGVLKAPYDTLLAEVVDMPMDDRGRKPRRPSATSRAESKVKSRMASGASQKAAVKPAAQKPVLKKPVVRKPVAKKPVVRKPVAKKPVAKKAATKKPAAKKSVAKKPAPAKEVQPVEEAMAF
ncbi:hypothetical protein N9C70_03330 [Flavobacteriales bacterium]|nr:hypothetical protein [Flavobacteriales bacterium]